MKKKILFLCVLFLALLTLFAACSETKNETTETEKTEKTEATEETEAPKSEEALSYNGSGTPTASSDSYRVFYEIFVGSFSDSNGDGIGDLRGIINRMDYLNDGNPSSGKSLGVEGLCLTPIFSSHTYHKYDVLDYYTIDPSFGTMADLGELLALCHSRNVKVIIDLPINYTSTGHEWFLNFTRAHRQKDASDPFYTYYSFHTADEPTPAGRSYAQLAGTADYYECNFTDSMPELDFDNEKVRAQMVDVAKYYLEMGVDGFRFDAAKYIYYGDNKKSADFWLWYVNELRMIKEDLYTIGEVWDSDSITDTYYPALDCFNFTTHGSSGLIAETAVAGDVNRYVSYIGSYLDKISSLRNGSMIAQFIANHNTDRAAGYLTVLSGNAQMAANLYILSSGSPFIYYGEEIGMRGSRGGATSDANRRLAMLWGDGDTVKDPTEATYTANTANPVSVQIADENSLYSYYKKLLLIRSAHPEIARGEYTPLSFGDKAGGFIATYEGSSVAVLHNTTNRTITLKISDTSGLSFTKISAEITPIADNPLVTFDGDSVVLPPQTSVVLR